MTKPQTDIEEIKELVDVGFPMRSEETDRRPVIGQINDVVTLSPDQLAARNRRNLWIALSVGAFMALVFAITLTQMQAGA